MKLQDLGQEYLDFFFSHQKNYSLDHLAIQFEEENQKVILEKICISTACLKFQLITFLFDHCRTMGLYMHVFTRQLVLNKILVLQFVRITSGTDQLVIGRYVAPEVLKHEEYDTKVDVFSFALILQEVSSYSSQYFSLMHQLLIKLLQLCPVWEKKYQFVLGELAITSCFVDVLASYFT